jgi:hypothetical protein
LDGGRQVGDGAAQLPDFRFGFRGFFFPPLSFFGELSAERRVFSPEPLYSRHVYVVSQGRGIFCATRRVFTFYFPGAGFP